MVTTRFGCVGNNKIIQRPRQVEMTLSEALLYARCRVDFDRPQCQWLVARQSKVVLVTRRIGRKGQHRLLVSVVVVDVITREQLSWRLSRDNDTRA